MRQPIPACILLIDDDMDDYMLFREALKRVDRTISLLRTVHGFEALQLLELPDSTLPDLIFLDWNMPQMNGPQFLTEIKRSDRLGQIPIIVCSTSDAKKDKQEAARLGACCYITKPMDFQHLIEMLKFILFNKPVPGTYAYDIEVFREI